jgi:hypothetical protein
MNITTITKPGHHLVSLDKVHEWRIKTKSDTMMSTCAYCDEDINKTGHLRCSHSCSTYCVWVNTVTLAKITLELNT